MGRTSADPDRNKPSEVFIDGGGDEGVGVQVGSEERKCRGRRDVRVSPFSCLQLCVLCDGVFQCDDGDLEPVEKDSLVTGRRSRLPLVGLSFPHRTCSRFSRNPGLPC